MSHWQRLNTRALLTKPGHSPIYHFTSDALWLIWANPPLTIGESLANKSQALKRKIFEGVKKGHKKLSLQ
ncbi:hypothetical protein AALA82_20820, partial [Oscillospiraceae bacterium 50-16]